MNSLFRMSLEKKLVSTTTLSLLALFGCAIFCFHRFSDGITEKLVDSIDSRNHMLMHDVSAMFNRRYANTLTFSANPVFLTNDVERMESSLNEYIKSFAMYEFITVTDLKGEVLATNTTHGGGKPVKLNELSKWHPTESDWFTAVVTGKLFEDTKNGFKPFFYGRPNDDRVDKKILGEALPLFPFAAAIKDSAGHPFRILTIFANLNWIEEELKRTLSLMESAGHGEGSLSLFGKNGDWFYSNKDRFVPPGADYAAKEFNFSKDVWTKSKFKGLITKADGSKHYVSVNRIEDAKFPMSVDMFIVQSVPEGSILGEYRSYIKLFYMLLSGVIVLITVGTFYVYRTFAQSLAEKLRILVGVIGKGKGICDELSGSSQQMSAASSEQAGAIQESVSALSEMTSMVAQTGTSSQLSLSSATSVSEKSEMGRKIMDRLTQTMKRIEERSAEFMTIHQAIRDIQTKTGVINDIVFKTQLLSFNASIEAARAGQEGRGFAVVAEEIGNLAKLSGTAAKEIETLLIESERRVGSSIDMIRQSVNEGAIVGNEATQSFHEIANVIHDIREQVSNVAEATRQQQLGIEEANKAMKQLGMIAKQNYDCAVSVEGHSKELASCTKSLVTIEGKLSRAICGGSELSDGDSVSLSAQFNNVAPVDTRPITAQDLPKDLSADDDLFRPAA